MHRLDFFVALNQSWQLIKTLKIKLWLWRLTQITRLVHGGLTFSPRKSLVYKEAITEGFICSWQNRCWTTKTWRYSILSFMKIENWWKLRLLKFLQVILTVSGIIFSDIFFPFCFNQHCEQCKGFFERKIGR